MISSHQEFKAILTKMTLILFSVTGIIAALLGLWQIKVSFTTLYYVNIPGSNSQRIDRKPEATCHVTTEMQNDDSYDINLLRFTGAFAFVYLAFILLAGLGTMLIRRLQILGILTPFLFCSTRTRVMFYKKQLIRKIVNFCQKLRDKN